MNRTYQSFASGESRKKLPSRRPSPARRVCNRRGFSVGGFGRRTFTVHPFGSGGTSVWLLRSTANILERTLRNSVLHTSRFHETRDVASQPVDLIISGMTTQQIAQALSDRFGDKVIASFPLDKHPRVHVNAADWR